MGCLSAEGAIIVEGPLTQGGKRGFPSRTKGSSGGVSLLEVWSGAFMFQLRTEFSVSVFYFLFFLFSFVVFLRGFACCCQGYVVLPVITTTCKMKIISFNVNGILNVIKMSKIMSKLKKEKAQIALLQETHMSQTDHLRLKRKGFKYVFFSSVNSKHKRGVAILISGALNYEHISEFGYDEGRFVKVTGRIEGSQITILNVYAPPGSDWLFYRNIFDLMVDSQGTLICGGDFNFRLNPGLDSSNPSNQSNPLIRKVNSYMVEMGIIDVWRELYPST